MRTFSAVVATSAGSCSVPDISYAKSSALIIDAPALLE